MRELPYTVRIHKSKHLEAEAWCRKKLGKRWSVVDNRQGIWCCFWSGPRSNYGTYDYHFAHERDMVWFSLKWC